MLRSLTVQHGERFEIQTNDASNGYFKTPDDKAIPSRRPGFDRSPPLANPIGIPVYLEGAERGDTLVVEIEEIIVGDYSWTAERNGRNEGETGGRSGDILLYSRRSEHAPRLFETK